MDGKSVHTAHTLVCLSVHVHVARPLLWGVVCSVQIYFLIVGFLMEKYGCSHEEN